MKKVLATATIFVLAVSANVGLAAPAQAVSVQSTSLVGDCVAQVQLAAPDSADALALCQVTTKTTTDAVGKVVTPADIKADASLSAQQRSDLLAAAAAGTIKSKHWSQFTTGAAYTVTHNGTFYYNGTRVWVTQTVSGYKGSHVCFTNYAVGLVITQGSCTKSGGTASRTLYDYWTVSFVFEGSPIAYGYSMNATVTKSGGISGPGATVG